MDGTKKLIIAVFVVIIVTIVAFIVVRRNNINFINSGKEETDGTLYFNITENYDKNYEELSGSRYSYLDEFELEIKKDEGTNIPSMYQQIRVTVKHISEDDVVTLKSTMTFHNNADYSDKGFTEFEIRPNESLKLYFNGPDTAGFVTARYEKY